MSESGHFYLDGCGIMTDGDDDVRLHWRGEFEDLVGREGVRCEAAQFYSSDYVRPPPERDAHDFGVLSVEGARVFWKIDLLPVVDAARPGAVRRILTLFLPSEA